MDWEGGNGEVEEDEDETKEKLTKWRVDKSFSAIINSNPTDLSVSSQHLHRLITHTNSNLTNSITSTTSGSTLASSSHLLQYHNLHHHNHPQHPFSSTAASVGANNSINNQNIISSLNNNGSPNHNNNTINHNNNNNSSPKLAHVNNLFVSTTTCGGLGALSNNSPSSSTSSGLGSPSSITLDLSTVKSEPNLPNSSGTGSGRNNSGGSGSTSASSSSGVRKPKPIPPPLDLSIGAANLSLNSPSLVTPTPTSLFQTHIQQCANNFCSSGSGGSITHSPFYWASSPKFNQAEKSLPLRKRWHSWSPIQMNCSDDPMLPLYTDTHLMSIKQERVDHHGHHGSQQNGCGTPNGYGHSRSSHPAASCSGNINQHLQQQHQQNNSIFNQGTGLQTPTPFYTPNEPSPKFMNSPVFSYSTPDTSLYQGPFSPIRSSTLYPPPSSPFMNTNSSLNTPTFTMTPNMLSTSTTMTMSGMNSTSNSNNGNNNNNSCFNMVPSSLLSPAPSQASTNSLSYEDLHEKSSSAPLNFTPAWNIFMSGTKVRFDGGNLDWYPVDFLAQNAESLGLKRDYAPNGLVVRTLVVPCSIRERIQITFCPAADPHHPAIEVNCESGHPFMVEKKGWCAVKPDAFFETYGTHCQALEGGDVCHSLAAVSVAAKSPPQTTHHHQQQQHQNFNGQLQSCTMEQGHTMGPCVNLTNGISPPPNSLLATLDEKSVPISVIPQHIIQLSSPPNKKLSAASQQGQTFGSGGKRSNKEANGQTQKGRRPMNAFLLFAKDKRPELIQQYPGKDNRSISVLLGEAWQSLAPNEKEKYASSARLRAEEQKRMHPDCWKRKRSQSQPAV